MKIVFSRKGFDSQSGGSPSAILPGGLLVPFPIPASNDPHSYEEVTINGAPLGTIVEDLTNGRITKTRSCHLDPDLDPASLPRVIGWRPAFGQIGVAQSHLTKHRIGVGDLFLFFGWFREVEEIGNRWRYIPKAPDIHVIYGWMQIGAVIGLASVDRLAPQMTPFADHPHLRGREQLSNTLFLGADRLDLPGSTRKGAGLFSEISQDIILTDVSQGKRSTWRLPDWFHPQRGTVLSYHENPDRWSLVGSDCVLSSAARGQEFVLNHTSNIAADAWLRRIFST